MLRRLLLNHPRRARGIYYYVIFIFIVSTIQETENLQVEPEHHKFEIYFTTYVPISCIADILYESIIY